MGVGWLLTAPPIPGAYVTLVVGIAVATAPLCRPTTVSTASGPALL